MNKTSKPSVRQVIQSILAGAIGVQSNQKREQDFEGNSFWPYIFGGVVFTLLFVVVLIGLVRMVS